MKKKLMLSIMSTVLISLVLVTVLFVFIVDYEHEQNIKQTLKVKNMIIINLIQNKNIKDLNMFFKEDFKNSGIRITYIDKDGKVLYDTEADAEKMENHNGRAEIIEARSKGEGSSVRPSSTLNINMMYYATEFGDGLIMRSSMPMRAVSNFEDTYLNYYIGIICLVFLISLLVSSRMTYIMLRPIEELKDVTGDIAKGDLNKRAKANTNDEIGELGRTFNDMTDKLQLTINDAVDKKYRLEAILKSMESGVIAVDKNKKIIMINPYAEKIFGIKKDIIGQNFLDIIRNYELEDIFDMNKEKTMEIKLLWPQERELRIKTADIINGIELIGTVAVIQDVTDIRKLENMRSQFVANVSHELKTPLTSIKGFAETLKDVEDQKTREKFLNIINDEAERLTRLINDILILSDLEQHREGNVEEVDVKQIINDVYYLMKKTAENKSIDLIVTGNEPSIVMGNSDNFKQMLINLVDNAIKYSEAGDSVTIGSDNVENECVLWVSDTGPGIPPQHISRLFERFYRVDKARSRAKGGTGLGLAIVKHIVISFGGIIEVTSKVGEGSKFLIKIPAKVRS